MQKLRINKPKTRPIQIEPWFARYLNEGQLKVVMAILSHADIKDRRKDSFPSNRTIAFYCGFGDIKENSKAYIKYQSLSTEEEKIKFKNKRIKTAIITVANIKKSLEEIGLLRRELVGQKGKQVSYGILDLEWKKEQYIQEHDEFFNNNVADKSEDENKEFILKQIDEISKLAKEGNISTDNIADRLNKLSYILKSEKASEDIPVEDVEKVANYVLNTNKIQNKIDKGEIANTEAYKKSIISLIKKNEFNGAKDYYAGLIQREKEDIFNNLFFNIEEQENTIPYKKQILKFKNVELKDNIFISTYISDFGQVHNFVVTDKQLKYYLPSLFTFTKQNKEYLENYNNYILEFLEKQNIKKDENILMNIPISTTSTNDSS
ncbi:hypothetical protein H0A43_00165 [Arcobacter lanthieri]|uniref:hypothetical protein n=1 Tax=Aliarcobacter lanthieri TaxID=1355374 RepID=UPI001920A629|nr:hypothetical protein [Aliarcobacter lanthieri]MBL3518886.1 hypothetical protein [Aliarcobacter lanthieri]